MAQESHSETIHGLEAAFGLAREDRLIQFGNATLRIYDIMESGETEMRSLMAGESEIIASVPIREPIHTETRAFALSKDDFVPSVLQSASWSMGGRYRIIDQLSEPETVQAWIDKQMTPEAVVQAARDSVAEHEADSNAVIDCSNCDGEQTFHLECRSCEPGFMGRGMTFLDLETGETVSAAQESNEQCSTCDGTGYYDNLCPCCNGVGEIFKYPQIELVNEITGKSLVVSLNISELVARGDMNVYIDGFQEISEYGPERAERRLKLGLNQYLNDQAAKIEINRPNALMVNEHGTYESWLQDPWAIAHWLNKRTPTEEYMSGTYRDKKTPQEALRSFESMIAREFLVPADKQGVDRYSTHRMRPVRSRAETFNELRAQLGTRGYTLALGIGFIATEEYGPQLWAMTEDGQLVGELATDHSRDGVIETAIMRLNSMTNEEL